MENDKKKIHWDILNRLFSKGHVTYENYLKILKLHILYNKGIH